MDAVDDVAYYLAEWYLPELTDKSVDDVVAKLDAAAILVSSEGTPVRLVVTLAVPTDEVLYGVFGAPSARHRARGRAIRPACHTSGYLPTSARGSEKNRWPRWSDNPASQIAWNPNPRHNDVLIAVQQNRVKIKRTVV